MAGLLLPSIPVRWGVPLVLLAACADPGAGPCRTDEDCLEGLLCDPRLGCIPSDGEVSPDETETTQDALEQQDRDEREEPEVPPEAGDDGDPCDPDESDECCWLRRGCLEDERFCDTYDRSCLATDDECDDDDGECWVAECDCDDPACEDTADCGRRD